MTRPWPGPAPLELGQASLIEGRRGRLDRVGSARLEHGFDDDPQTQVLLRSPPPQGALSWVEAMTGASVVASRPLLGGMSSAVHEVTLRSAGGTATEVVLRRYVRPDLNVEEPDIAAREGRALQLVRDLPLATPELLGVDPTGKDAGVPAVLMSRLPGEVDWAPRDMPGWLTRLAELLAPIHAAHVPFGLIRPYAAYDQLCYAPPVWAADRRVWEVAVEIFRGPVPDGPGVFLHRDYHPGNVLWRGSAVSGVVDWASVAVGPVSVDVGHCRANLARSFDAAVADRFSRDWEHRSGHHFDPWADVSAIIGFLDDIRDDPPPGHSSLEAVVARAVADLGGAV